MAVKRQSFPGFGERLKEAMRAAGYWKHDKPDVAALDAAHRFLKQSVYEWLNDTASPSYGNLMRLAAVLRVTPGWLLLGKFADEIPAPGEVEDGPPEGVERQPPTRPDRADKGGRRPLRQDADPPRGKHARRR